MTKIKLCGIRRIEDIEAVNSLKPDYIGFVFAKASKRYVTGTEAKRLKEALVPGIQAAGVFVDENINNVADLLEKGIIDIAQLHGNEDEKYIDELRRLSGKPLIRAFRVKKRDDLKKAMECSADHILLDAGAGDGETFEWGWLKEFERPFILAGGLDADNVGRAISLLHPYGVDVSSGIETDGFKDEGKMRAFVEAVRRHTD
ncbi:MAG: phosphoribosylanthranilate isomerase [Lachnospiraceae bacterium]|nr:phosphoribosylanthranilate isomerase [Lachnospiraceae bacterium]